jgi:N-acetylmuramoyl-L-alanine amidase
VSDKFGDEGSKKPNTESQFTEDTQGGSETESQIDTETETESETETETETEEPDVYGKITASKLKLRKEPNTDCEVLANIPQGTEVLIIEVLDGWYKAYYDGQEGYLSADYVEILDGTENEQEANRTEGSNGYVVMIDPGHQLHGDSTLEPNGPGSSEMKARVTSGTSGGTTGVDEYVLNLEISLALRDELEARGYTVYMTREVHEVSLSNKERAEMANALQADISFRVHCNGSDDTSISGALCMAPSASNPYVGELAADSQRLSQCVVDAYCKATGLKNRGVLLTDTMTGINWCEMPVTIIEMGFMSNPSDDTNMQDDAFQVKMIKGMADGIDDYFGL